VDAYCLNSATHCLLPSLGLHRTDLFIIAGPEFRHGRAERIAVVVDRQKDPTVFEATNSLRQVRPNQTIQAAA
jgi:hypothetical protein